MYSVSHIHWKHYESFISKNLVSRHFLYFSCRRRWLKICEKHLLLTEKDNLLVILFARICVTVHDVFENNEELCPAEWLSRNIWSLLRKARDSQYSSVDLKALKSTRFTAKVMWNFSEFNFLFLLELLAFQCSTYLYTPA